MKNRIMSIILVCMLLVTFSFTVCAISNLTPSITVKMKTVGNNTGLVNISKPSNATTTKSSIIVYTSGSTVNKVNVWVKNDAGEWCCSKLTIYPDNTEYELQYYNGKSIPINDTVHFQGEQFNVSQKYIKFAVRP